MANVKITDLPTKQSVASTDYLVVDDGTTTYKAEKSKIVSDPIPFSFVGMVIQGTNLTTLADVQEIYGSDTTWQLISSVALASEHVVGNGNVLGITNGTYQGFLSGTGNRDLYNLRSTLPQPLGTVGGTQFLGANGFGVITKTQASNDLSATGLIVDTITVYMWERIA